MTNQILNNQLVLGSIPDGLRKPLFESFNEINRNYRERRWEPAELNGGKLCEIIYTILRGYINKNYPSKPSKPNNFLKSCNDLEQVNANYSRSIRIQIPRVLIALYDIRNNRGVSHAGGDVNPNYMDATAVLYMSKWLMAELIRIFHNVDTITATEVIESIIDRTLPLIWEVNGVKRVLNEALALSEKTLVLLYHTQTHVNEQQMRTWLDHDNLNNLRRTFKNLHKQRLIDYNNDSGDLIISPTGSRYVEERIELEV